MTFLLRRGGLFAPPFTLTTNEIPEIDSLGSLDDYRAARSMNAMGGHPPDCAAPMVSKP